MRAASWMVGLGWAGDRFQSIVSVRAAHAAG
jgi:hypothetical protein